MDQFRENEIKKIREDERLKCQMELQSLRKEVWNIEINITRLYILLYLA
jgi:hypothetical protein